MTRKQRRRIPADVRFDRFVEKSATCWRWTGALFPGGYGAFWNGDKLVRAHRFSYERAFGRLIAAGMDIDHLCRVRECVRPDHLEEVTRAENLRRGANEKMLVHRARIESGVCPKGLHPNSRWNERHHYCRGCASMKAVDRRKQQEAR